MNYLFSKRILHENLKKLIFVWLGTILMISTCSYYANEVVARHVFLHSHHILKAVEEHINSAFRESSVVLLSAAISLQYKLENENPPSIEDMQKFIATLNDEYTNIEGPASEFMHLYAWVEGRLFYGSGWEPPSNTRGPSSHWNSRAISLESDKVIISDVYRDARTHRSAISLSAIIPSDSPSSENHGVICMDINLQGIMDKVRELYFAEGSYGMLLDRSLCYIAYADTDLIGKSLTDVSPDHGKIAARLGAGEMEISSEKVFNAFGQEVVTFYKRLENGWVIGMSTPTINYYWDAYCMVSLLAILGLIMAVSSSIFILRLSVEKLRANDENKSKSSFLARMSHEIRTPMNSILGMTEIVSRKRIPRDVLENISIIRHSGENLLNIINDILDFSKIESGKFSLDPRKYTLSSVINDVINLVRIQLTEKKNIDFLVYVDSRIPAYLVGDDLRIRQILLNLISNAIKYTNEGFISLKIRLGKTPPPEKNFGSGAHQLQLIFQVKDTGFGIRKEDLNSLFTEFQRLDYLRRQRVEGSGLGLVITNTFCRMMGGSVTVESEYGHGSTFTASLFQAIEDSTALARVEDPEQKPVLLFEDRDLLNLSLRMALRDLGVPFEVAPDLQEFVKMLGKNTFHTAFVPSRFVMDCVGALGRSGLPPNLTAMMEIGELRSLSGLKNILLPIYSINLANALNGLLDDAQAESRMWRKPFSAPDATVLIVDDITTNLRVAKELITHYGIVAHTCLSGSDAVELVRKKCYDVVFMDHMMPEMDGLEVTAAIRSLSDDDPYFEKLPIVALTANVVSGQREMFLQNGFNDFLTKPIEMSKLDYVLRRWIPESKQITHLPNDEVKRVEILELDLAEINVKAGLRNVGGTVATYLDILADFQHDAWKRMAQLKAAAERGDLHTYAILAHALKGASRTLGAMDFADLAARLEKSASNGDQKTVDAQSPLLLYQLEKLAEHIGMARRLREGGMQRRTDGNAGAKYGADLDTSELKLDTLKVALDSMDISTVNYILLEYSKKDLKARTRDFISEIEQHILNFEYDDALKKINLHL